MSQWFCFKRTVLVIFLVTLVITPIFSQHKYRYTFETKTDSHGKILLVIPYRMYFKAYSEIDLISHQNNQNQLIFKLDSIKNSGYLSRTLGFSGRKLGIFTANPTTTDYTIVSKNISDHFKKDEKFYSRYIKKTIYFPYRFLDNEEFDNFFIRHKTGVQTNSNFSIPIKHNNPNIKIKTFFRIYEILADSLEFYNHSFLPSKINDIDQLQLNSSWKSKELDFTSLLNNVLAKSAKIMKYILPFKQKKPFVIDYHVSHKDERYIAIKGSARPMIPIWRAYQIVLFTREVKIDFKNNLLIYDNFLADVRNKEGEGGYARTFLKLLNSTGY